MYDLPKLDLKSTEKSIENFIKDYTMKSGKDGVVLGISGGLDSACVATLAANALGRDNVLGVQMPEKTGNNCHHWNQADYDCMDAGKLIENLGIKREGLDLNKFIEPYYRNLKTMDKKTMGNVKARTRMSILYAFANGQNKLVAGTGDKSEILTGYFTKYGDGGVDMLPIGNLYKTQVRDLSREIGVPEKIIEKPSSPCLWEGQTAEGEMGIKYEVLDKVLFNLVDKKMPVKKVDFDRKTVEYVDGLIKRSAHKRDPLPKGEVIYCERL
jgi:NAD+ synthase